MSSLVPVRAFHQQLQWGLSAALIFILCTQFPLPSLAANVERLKPAEVEQLLDQAKQDNQRKDYAAARAIYERLIAANVPDGMVILGTMYVLGAGVAADPKRGCDLEQQAANLKFSLAYMALSECYFKGLGRGQDYHQSFYWTQKAADAGVTQAFCALGNHYFDGLGVTKDQKKGLELCRKAADLGSAEAQEDLGNRYLSGNGLPRSPPDAKIWLTKAAGQGRSNAALNLGLMLWKGDGVEKDEIAAERWLKAAAIGGHPKAYLPLGDFYFNKSLDKVNRVLVEQPATQALYWLAIAAVRDPDPAERAQAAKLRDALVQAAPRLRDKVNDMLKSGSPP